jgi:hypothetical protein
MIKCFFALVYSHVPVYYIHFNTTAVLPHFYATLQYILIYKLFFFSLSSYFSEHTVDIQAPFRLQGVPRREHDNPAIVITGVWLTHVKELTLSVAYTAGIAQ